MSDLSVEKTAFGPFYTSLMELATMLDDATYTLDLSEDNSQTGKKELACLEALMKLKSILAALARETAKDVEKNYANFMAVDQ